MQTGEEVLTIENAHKWLMIIILAAIVAMAVITTQPNGNDEKDPGVIPYPEDLSGSVTSTDFYFDDDEYGTWISGTITIYRSGDGFEGDVLLKYYEDPSDPYWLQFNTYSDFYMTELRTDHMHPEGSCWNAEILTPYFQEGEFGNKLFIDMENDCKYRDDGTVIIHLKSTEFMDSEQTQSEFVIGLSYQDGHHIFADLPMV